MVLSVDDVLRSFVLEAPVPVVSGARKILELGLVGKLCKVVNGQEPCLVCAHDLRVR